MSKIAPIQLPSAYPSAAWLMELLDLMILSREADKREAILFRQGRAKFQLPGAGHEALGAIAYALGKDDVIYPYYRDKALMLARGTSLEQLALDYFAKAASSSGGRQMASHFCSKDHNMVSCATPTGLQCLPAVGTAWGFKLSGKPQIVVCCIGEAATRQGEFYEALCFALQENLPIIFVVEDNGYGVSTATQSMTPYNIQALSKEHCTYVNGRDPEEVYEATDKAVRSARAHKPVVLWVEIDRLMSHTSSDDQRLYRSAEELAGLDARDPILLLSKKLQAQELLSEEQWRKTTVTAKATVAAIYEAAEKYPDPSDASTHIFSDTPLKPSPIQPLSQSGHTMAEAINSILHQLLSQNSKFLLFGEDICDPKGGVFGLTKGLSSIFPKRVYNSPLAEATICGLASGLAIVGFVPIFELQFIDFVGPAFNQLVNQVATLRWRTLGQYKCPMVILAPCGGYLGCGGPWHSQTNEAWFAHAPGLKVFMPSTPQAAAGTIAAAVCGEDPVLILLPKNLFRDYKEYEGIALHPEQARVRRVGDDITIIAWGNTVDIALAAASEGETRGLHAEVIDLHSIVPCDWGTINASVAKTGRLLVVQEDNRTCSMGQAIISECMSNKDLWSSLKAPPILIAREDVHVGFHQKLEKSVLPQVTDVIHGISELMEFA